MPKKFRPIDWECDEANEFAMELLMPKKFLMQDIESKDFDILDDEKMKKLAKKYQVTSALLGFRVAQIMKRESEYHGERSQGA